MRHSQPDGSGVRSPRACRRGRSVCTAADGPHVAAPRGTRDERHLGAASGSAGPSDQWRRSGSLQRAVDAGDGAGARPPPTDPRGGRRAVVEREHVRRHPAVRRAQGPKAASVSASSRARRRAWRNRPPPRDGRRCVHRQAIVGDAVPPQPGQLGPAQPATDGGCSASAVAGSMVAAAAVTGRTSSTVMESPAVCLAWRRRAARGDVRAEPPHRTAWACAARNTEWRSRIACVPTPLAHSGRRAVSAARRPSARITRCACRRSPWR